MNSCLNRVLTDFSPDIFSPSSLNDLSVPGFWQVDAQTHRLAYDIPVLPAPVNNHSQARQILLIFPLLLYW